MKIENSRRGNITVIAAIIVFFIAVTAIWLFGALGNSLSESLQFAKEVKASFDSARTK
jgi:hypothetical protein